MSYLFFGEHVNPNIIFKVATLALGVVGMGQLFYKLALDRKGRMRDEYKFARDFLEDKSKTERMHPFLREIGYRAIAGDERLCADEVEYLLSLKNSDRALRDYVMGKKYMTHLPCGGNLQISFKKKYRRPWTLKYMQIGYLALYILLATLALGPFLFSKFLFKDIRDMLLVSCFSLVVFGPYAWLSLNAAVRVHCAERLVANQAQHTQNILIDGH